MATREFKIHYNHAETGPAEVLKGRVARIVDHVFLRPDFLWKDDIVLLDRTPRQGDAFPCIEKVLRTRYPYRASYSYPHDFPLDLFLFLLRGCGLDGFVAIPATKKKSGRIHIAVEADFPLTDLFKMLGLQLKEEMPLTEAASVEDEDQDEALDTNDEELQPPPGGSIDPQAGKLGD